MPPFLLGGPPDVFGSVKIEAVAQLQLNDKEGAAGLSSAEKCSYQDSGWG